MDRAVPLGAGAKKVIVLLIFNFPTALITLARIVLTQLTATPLSHLNLDEPQLANLRQDDCVLLRPNEVYNYRKP